MNCMVCKKNFGYLNTLEITVKIADSRQILDKENIKICRDCEFKFTSESIVNEMISHIRRYMRCDRCHNMMDMCECEYELSEG